ncbi:heterokaryon incompatibility, partial [Leptodontidium sp. 2 PMI_412]
ICIDQTDEVEKTQQIRLMAEIYSKAKGVFIWLGRGDDESELAIALLNNHKLDPLTESQWRSILIFYRRRWFRRVWTLQEASLA